MDHCQLPPIKPKTGDYDPDKDSSVFELPDKYTLTEKMRQDEGDHVASLCDIIRTHIDGDMDLSWISDLKQQYDKRTSKGYSFSNEDAILKSFCNNFSDGVECRITAYRNSRIDYLNARIRTSIFGPKSSDRYVSGDLIVGNDIYNPKNDIIPIFYNGEDMIVENVYENIVDNIQCHELWVKYKDRPIYVVKECDIHKYNSRISKLKADAMVKHYWADYMQFKSQYANISYGYALTLYKVQGSTMHGTYVDVSDIFSVKPLTPKRKLQSFYVGASRPTHFLAMF